MPISSGQAKPVQLTFLSGTVAQIEEAAVQGLFDVGEPVWATDSSTLYIAANSTTVIPINNIGASLLNYFELAGNNLSTGDNTFSGPSRFTGLVSLGSLISSANNIDLWPTITPQTGSTSSILPLTDNTTRIATTEWVQALTNGFVPPGVALLAGENTFTNENVFTQSPRVATPLESDDSSRVANTEWVRNLVGSVATPANVAIQTAPNNFTQSNDFTGTLSANVSPKLYSTVVDTDREVATLGWVKREIGQISQDILPLDNTFTGANSFTTTPTTVTPSITDNSNKVATTAFVQSLVNSIGSAPTVLLGSSFNEISWDDGVVKVAGIDVDVSAGSITLPTASSTYYLFTEASGTVSYSTSIPSDGLMATIQISGTNTSIFVPTTGINVAEFARVNSPNNFTASNFFGGTTNLATTNFGTGANAAVFNSLEGFKFGRALGTYTIPINENSQVLATTEWVNSRLGSTTGTSPWVQVSDTISPLGTVGIVDLSAVDGLAKNPPTGSDDNSIATTKWVTDYVTGRPTFPSVIYPGTGLLLNYESGYVIPPEEANCGACVDGRCAIGNGSIAITLNTKYVWVRYADCQVIASESPPEELEGKVIALINASGGPGTVEVTPITEGTYAPIESPVFTGMPKAPEPDAKDCSNQVATTNWVCDKMERMLHSSCDGINIPRVYQVIPSGQTESLLVNVEPGSIRNINNNEIIPVEGLAQAVALVESTDEYVWIRYADANLVASKDRPSTAEGFVLAVVTTDETNIVRIVRAQEAFIETAITVNYAVAWGGRLVYIGPSECEG